MCAVVADELDAAAILGEVLKFGAEGSAIV